MTPVEKTTKFERHLTEVAAIAKRIGEKLDLKADAQQACFATILISADKHGVFFDVANPEQTTDANKKDVQAATNADTQIKDVPRHPTPAQAEAGAKKALYAGVKRACLLLNQEGFQPALSSKTENGKESTLDAYVKKETQLGKPFSEFDSEDMEALIKNLTFKLDDLRSKKKAQESDAGF
jgi:hypothetical protein